ncbi:MAG: ABC transporter ATP-binding protein [Alphaproteobacteria bacterium]|nr:ABC transporter ATP-binding protein [Alphaproteobacteria bacterium]
MSARLAIAGLSVRYGAVVALEGVALEVGAGEAVALLGANGAGKSSLLQAVMALTPIAAGDVMLDGAPLRDLPTHRRVALGIGYCPEGRRVFPGMTVRDNLAVASPLAARDRDAAIAQKFELFPDLRAKADDLAWQLSGGQQQMLAIARALMTEPRLLLLDEPSLGLAPRLVAELFDRIRAIQAAGTAVLLAEQNVAQALRVTDRAYVLQVGRVVAAGASAALRDSPAIRVAFLGG